MINRRSSRRILRPSMTSWLGNACCLFMKFETRMKNTMKMSRCTKEVRKKWYARKRKAWVLYLLLMDRMTRAALTALAVFTGAWNRIALLKAMADVERNGSVAGSPMSKVSLSIAGFGGDV